jgi:hypothetical protein
VHILCELTVSVDASGGVATELQRGTKSYLLSTECTEPVHVLVRHRIGASLSAISSLPVEHAHVGLRSAGTLPWQALAWDNREHGQARKEATGKQKPTSRREVLQHVA